MRGWSVALGIWACGCSGGAGTTDTGGDPDPTGGACGDVLSTDIDVSGRVEDRGGNVVGNAAVWLEERNWAPGTVHGSGTADAGGTFTFFASDLPIIEGCWGTAVSFYLVGEAAGLYGDKPVNPQVINAWNDGSLDIEYTNFPLVLDAATE